jgi:hypothetical protein
MLLISGERIYACVKSALLRVSDTACCSFPGSYRHYLPVTIGITPPSTSVSITASSAAAASQRPVTAKSAMVLCLPGRVAWRVDEEFWKRFGVVRGIKGWVEG